VTDPIHDRVQIAVSAALDKKALDLDVLEVGHLTSIADYFILCSGTTERQTRTISEAVVDRLRDRHVKPLMVEGSSPGRWILIDYGDFIIHVFTGECRRFYGLERLWGDAPNVTGEFSGGQQPRLHEANK
jgi:ribosome-associated protein